MVTQQQAIDWLHAQKGKALDFDGAYGCQCADYFNYYFQYISNGVSPYSVFGYYEGAKDLWVPTDYFDLIPDSDTLFPLPGDVFIYGASWGGGYGHVDMCIVSDANGSTYSGQNENGNPYNTCVTEGYRTWAQQSGLTGVMRPKFSVAAPAPEPAPEVPTPPTLPTPEPTPEVPTPPTPPVVVPEPTPEPKPEPVKPSLIIESHTTSTVTLKPVDKPIPPSTNSKPLNISLAHLLIKLIKKLLRLK